MSLRYIHFFLLLIIFSACKKDHINETNPASIQPVNLLNDGVILRANLSGQHPIRYSQALQLPNKTYNSQSIFINNFPQLLELYAQPDTMPHDRPVISTDLQLQPGKMYSMFIHGEKASATYTVHEDNFPAVSMKDSLTFIRFANFSEAQSISVNVKGQAPGSFLQSLPFKSIGSFSTLTIGPPRPVWEFEIRNEVSGALLATYSFTHTTVANFTAWRNKAQTLIFTGIPAGTGTNQQRIILMRHR